MRQQARRRGGTRAVARAAGQLKQQMRRRSGQSIWPTSGTTGSWNAWKKIPASKWPLHLCLPCCALLWHCSICTSRSCWAVHAAVAALLLLLLLLQRCTARQPAGRSLSALRAPPPDCRRQGQAISALLRANEYRGFKLWRTISILAREEGDAGPAAAQRHTYRCVHAAPPAQPDPCCVALRASYPACMPLPCGSSWRPQQRACGASLRLSYALCNKALHARHCPPLQRWGVGAVSLGAAARPGAKGGCRTHPDFRGGEVAPMPPVQLPVVA